MKASTFDTCTVLLGERSYPIYVGAGILGDVERYAPHVRGRRVCIVTNDTLEALYLDALRGPLSERFGVDSVVLPDGERHKTLATFERLVSHLLDAGHTRASTLIALGGGVVGDLTGFAAATYQRGVDFLQVPTTLLAQVDSSVGGKTAVNHPRGKNMIGAFHQPRAVIADMNVLATLPERELRAGLAEVVKYGVIADHGFFEWLETSQAALLARDVGALRYAVRRSCEIKADIVAADEREGGLRAILNFGHTFAHAIETTAGYGCWLHGEAVAIGMVLAARLSVAMGRLPDASGARIERLIDAFGLPHSAPGLSVDALIEAMRRDKKVIDGGLRLIVTGGLGEAHIIDHVNEAMVREVLKDGILA